MLNAHSGSLMTATSVTDDAFSFFACAAIWRRNGAASVEILVWYRFRLVLSTVTGVRSNSFASRFSSRDIRRADYSYGIPVHDASVSIVRM